MTVKTHEIQVWKHQLKKIRRAGDIREEGRVCSHIAHLYEQVDDLKQALRYHQRDFQLSNASGDVKDQALACGNIARCLAK
jgi:hypothetical protein